jgi:pimeloyl-ACP methyl ester carboxylesterase
MDLAGINDTITQGTFYANPLSTPNDRTLLVFVPGFRLKPLAFQGLLTNLMQEEFLQGCDLLPFEYNNHRLSNADPEDISIQLTQTIEDRHRERGYQSVYLLGHSIGALLIRRTILIGYESDFTWIRRIRRLVILAGTNRGYVPALPTDKMGALVISFFGLPISRLIMSCLRGAPWVTALRMEWLRRFNPEASAKQPPTVQFYGTLDRVVALDDASEINRFDNACFIQLEAVTHEGFAAIRDKAHTHYQRIRNALVHELPATVKPRTEKRDHLVFLIHGICDFAEWQDALEYEIESLEKNIVVIPVQYGYFTILQFLIPHQQRRAIRVFVDKYVQEVSKSPQATIAVAAHSNGTLVFERAVRENRFLKVDRAYLAGSILPSKIQWDQPPYCDQVKQIRNITATRDWPVGILVNSLRWIYRSFGTAGFHGFKNKKLNYSLEGAHDVALQPHHRGEVAKYLVGNDTEVKQELKPSPVMSFFSRTSLVWLALILTVIGHIYYLIAASALPSGLMVFLSACFTLFLFWLLQRI